MATPSPKLLIVSLLGILVYLGLAFWAGRLRRVLRSPRSRRIDGRDVRACYRRAVHGRKPEPGRARGSQQPLGDRGNRCHRAACRVLLPAYADRLEVWTITGDACAGVGVALYVVGGVLRLWPVFVLGNRFSGLVAIQPGAYAGHGWHLWRHSPPELSRPARERARLGARVSLRRRRARLRHFCLFRWWRA